AALDDTAARALGDRVSLALREASRDGAFACALLPPVLGLRVSSAERPLAAALSEAAGVPVVEVLALPQSAPGQRLAAALEAGASRAGVVVKKSDALSSLVEGGRVL